jgi:uncharacterized protein YkwD
VFYLHCGYLDYKWTKPVPNIIKRGGFPPPCKGGLEMKIIKNRKRLPARFILYLCAIAMAVAGISSMHNTLASAVQGVFPESVTATRSFRAETGKSYSLPAEVKRAGDVYKSSNITALDVNPDTGSFSTLKDGIAYIVANNAGQVRYFKITSENGAAQASRPAANNSSALADYNVTVTDETTPATQAYAESWPITTYYFAAANGTKLGSISGETMTGIQMKLGNTTPSDYDGWSDWFASEFNKLRGISADSAKIAFEEHNAELIEQYRQEVFRLVNEEREKAGVVHLIWDDFLGDSAQTRAEECASLNSIYVEGVPHTRPDGSHWTTVLWTRRYTYHTTGENSAYGFADAKDLMNMWMASDGHRRNILKTGRTRMGVGIAVSESGAKYGIQIFGTHMDDIYED